MKTIKALILEDNLDRVVMFRDRAASLSERGLLDLSLTHEESVQDCLEALTDETFDVIFLDHDLDGHTYVDPASPRCGSEVARFLRENPEARSKHGKVFVHSLNEKASPSMCAMIPNSEWAPGLWAPAFWKDYGVEDHLLSL